MFNLFKNDHRHGFTLVELLASMTIIGILAIALISGLSMVRNRAAYARTQQTIARLSEPVRRRYELYRSRRLPVDVTAIVRNDKNFDTIDKRMTPAFRRTMDWKRLWAMRELVRMEMPDAYADITFVPKFLVAADAKQNSLPYYPRLREAYRARVLMVVPGDGDFDSKLAQVALVESAELLYALVYLSNEDRDLMSVAFTPSDVGDFDGDGMPEFLDSWGNPLRFVRWPAGYVSDMQPLLQRPSLNNSDIKNMTALQRQSLPFDVINQIYQYNPYVIDKYNSNNIFYITRDPYNRHDPIDPRGVEAWQSTSSLSSASNGKAISADINGLLVNPSSSTDFGWPERGYTLMPLISSAGADGELGYLRDTNSPVNSNPYLTWTNPYYIQTGGTQGEMVANYYDQQQLWNNHVLQVADPMILDNVDNHRILGTFGGF